jgi:hypothetical protein
MTMNRRDALKHTVGWAGLALLAPTAGTWACKIEDSSKTDGKASPQAGSTAVVVVSVRHTHRRCTLPIEKTKFVPTGMKILGATPWRETRAGSYERKLKVRFLEKGQAKLRVVRNCSRGGCSQDLEFTVGS